MTEFEHHLGVAPDEYLDTVDTSDNVIGRELRSVLYKEGVSNFRVVNGFIRNDNGELWIPVRALGKRVSPGGLDFSIGEHVESGESYDDAFKRGVQEELNMDVTKIDFSLLGKLTPTDGTSSFMQVYEIRSDTVPPYNPKDFTRSMWVSPSALKKTILQGQPAKSDLITVLNRFYPAK